MHSGVICLGEALVDRLGPPGGDPAVDLPLQDCLGGAPVNVACALARLGTSVTYLGRLGCDSIGSCFAELFRRRALDTSAVQWDSMHPSRIVLVRRRVNGEREFQGFFGDQGAGFADQALSPVVLPQRARWLLVGSLPLASPSSALALRGAVTQAQARDIALAVDVNWRPTFWDSDADPSDGPSSDASAMIRPLLEQASLIKLAREEAHWFFATDEPSSIKAMLPQHPDVVVTDGAAPVRWCFQGQAGEQAAFTPAKVVDTTGAGDAFMAGLLHRWDALPEERVRFASACGALVCGGEGAIDPQPDESEVNAFLDGLKR